VRTNLRQALLDTYARRLPDDIAERETATRDASHVHTAWRDPVADLGMDALGAHRRRQH